MDGHDGCLSSLENSDCLQMAAWSSSTVHSLLEWSLAKFFLSPRVIWLVSLVPTVFPVVLVICQVTEGSGHGFQQYHGTVENFPTFWCA